MGARDAILGAKALVSLGANPLLEWTKATIKLGKDKVEVTNSDSGMWKEFLQGHKEWSVTFDCNLRLDDTTGQKALLDSFLADDDDDAILSNVTVTNISGGTVFSGDMFVTDMPLTFDLKKEQSVSITLQGTGEMGVA